MEIGYKILNNSKFELEVGKTYYVDNDASIKELPEDQIIISKTVNSPIRGLIEYKKDLKSLINKYTPTDVKIVKLEILAVDQVKYGARVVKVLEEVVGSEIVMIKDKIKLEKIEINLNIELVKTLQKSFPNLIIGGSVSLFLQGARLNRFSEGGSDLDIILPYYDDLQCENVSVVEEEDKMSGSDYAYNLSIDGVKADVRIDLNSKYERVEYGGFTFKVVPLHIIIEAKARYASSKWGEKHRDDLKELILNK